MKSIIQFKIEKGEKYYIAIGIDLPIVTQAKTLDELAKNIREATDLHLEKANFKKLNIVKSPSIFLNFELPNIKHA